VQTLKEEASEILRAAEQPVIHVAALPMPGRAGRVITAVQANRI
jgi:hypothetical protein